MHDIRQRIIDTTLELYERDGERPHVEDICGAAKVTEAEFRHRFGGIGAVFAKHFALTVADAAATTRELPDYTAMSLQDRLGALCFILLDLLEQYPTVARDRFARNAAGFFSPFQVVLRQELADILDARDVPGVNRLAVDTSVNRFVVAETMVRLVGVSVRDDSPDRARSAGLIDGAVSLWSELLTTRIPDKFVGLIRYGVEAGYLPLDRLPIVGEWFGGRTATDTDTTSPDE